MLQVELLMPGVCRTFDFKTEEEAGSCWESEYKKWLAKRVRFEYHEEAVAMMEGDEACVRQVNRAI